MDFLALNRRSSAGHRTATGYLTPNVYNGLPGPNVFGYAATPNGQPIYSLNTQLYLLPTAIPEPGTLALAGLGGLCLFLFCRQRTRDESL